MLEVCISSSCDQRIIIHIRIRRVMTFPATEACTLTLCNYDTIALARIQKEAGKIVGAAVWREIKLGQKTSLIETNVGEYELTACHNSLDLTSLMTKVSGSRWLTVIPIISSR
ncbi:hypothetical protein FRC19_010241 [Serendipita sp. 401]|nr:hypothetical protein FRC15_011094 [Serendipita sp. 397]KAG8818915.1 hypothetical protein FRC19_010241 [Serendipita sp. 401]KAG9041233.1 hypothetical protein FS842_002631 [Serendipita sp. 407]